MGRRDSEGKKKPWQIEAGDWEKLYEALLKAKEKNIMLDVKLQRQKDVIELQRKYRDRTLYNELFEQKQLAFKYKIQKKQSKQPKKESEHLEESVVRKMIRKISMPAIAFKKQATAMSQSLQKTGQGSKRQFTLPLMKSTTITERPEKSSSKDTDTSAIETKPLQRSCTLPNLYTLYDKSGQNGSIHDADYWVGDPEAISSVRRPRLNPSEMTDYSQPSGQARKLLIDIASPQTCSRQYTARTDDNNLPDITGYHLRHAGSHQNLLSTAGLLQ